MKSNHSLFLPVSLLVLVLECSLIPSLSPGQPKALYEGPHHTADLPGFVKPHPSATPSPVGNPRETGSKKQTHQLTAWLASSDKTNAYIQYYITDDNGTGPTFDRSNETSSPSKLFTTIFDFQKDIKVFTVGKEVQITGRDTKGNKVKFVSHCTISSNLNYDVTWSP